MLGVTGFGGWVGGPAVVADVGLGGKCDGGERAGILVAAVTAAAATGVGLVVIGSGGIPVALAAAVAAAVFLVVGCLGGKIPLVPVRRVDLFSYSCSS